MANFKALVVAALTAASLLATPMVQAQSIAPVEPPAAPAEAIAARGLFVSLTTDDTWAAAKAIMFAHRRSLANGHPTAIWLNVRGVYLAEAGRPSHIHGLMAETGTSIHDMLRAFMADGGRVFMCSACSAAAGLTQEEYIDGVEMGSWPLIESWLFNPNVTTLTW